MSTIYKGGYVTIDLLGIDLTGDSVVVSGAYNTLVEAKGKPVYFINVNDGTNTYAVVTPSSVAYNTDEVDFYAFVGAPIGLYIANDDSITLEIIT